ncbi:MAG: carboxypeptidase regulatory-like domain-containing protein [Thermoanaerobaculia bacterium]
MSRSLRRFSSFLILQVLCFAVAGAQIWAGEAVVRGVVTDIDGHPIAGAQVALALVNQPGAGPRTVKTDNQGRWRIGGIAEGRWDLVIEARGFVSVEGWVQSAERYSEPVEVWMRPLEEVTAGFAESSSSVRWWLAKANTLLEQGHYDEARTEYEKALGALPRSSQPEVLRSIARTHYLQGDQEGAIRTLQWALVVSPADTHSYQLYTTLMGQLGRGPEARRFLNDLEVRTPTELTQMADEYSAALPKVETRTSSLAERPEIPIEEPMAGRTGSFRVRFLEKSPHSSLEVLLQRLNLDRADVEAADHSGGAYVLKDESFRVYVPPSYSPDAGFGLLVWISPTPFGGFVAAEMRQALDRNRLIWVGADNAGNGRARWYRYLLALDAAHNILKLYSVDDDQVFVGGYSGGGRVTSGLAMLYSEVFQGGFSMFGCDYPERLSVPDKPGAHWPPGFPAPPKSELHQVKSRSRFVLLTGQLDFNRAQTRKTYLKMLDDGFEHVLYLQVPDASHYDHPDEAILTQGFSFLIGEPLGP